MRYSILLSLVFCTALSFGQAEKDSLDLIFIEHADETIIVKEDNQLIRYLYGDVKMYQDSTYMFCDSAIMIANNLTAYGNVVIVQSDTISIFSDSLVYHGDTQHAWLYRNVTLENGDQKLFTQTMFYDIGDRIATYQDTALMIKDTTILQSRKGIYDVNKELATFKEDVIVRDSSFDLRADSLKYHTGLDKVIFISSTHIVTDSAKIYCRSGYYDFHLDKAKFGGNPQYVNEETVATADSILYDHNYGDVFLMGNAVYKEINKYAEADLIHYNEKTKQTNLKGEGHYKDGNSTVSGELVFYDELTSTFKVRGKGFISDPPMTIIADSIDYAKKLGTGLAGGNVIWRDTSAKISIFCDKIFYEKDRSKVRALGYDERPLLTNDMKGDTLFLSADTLLVYELVEQQDTFRQFSGFHDVRIYKSDIQALSDSLHFDGRDSVLTLFDNPYVWSDTTQFSGDTIHMYLRNEALDRVHVKGNGFILNNIESEYYNQIKGRQIEAFFMNDSLHQMTVVGNAEAYYYFQDEAKAFIGLNTTLCSSMRFSFKDNQVESLHFYDKSTSKMIPIQKVDPIKMRLENFYWNGEIKPNSVDDLRSWRIKVTEQPLKIETESEDKKEVKTEAKLIDNK